MVTVNLTVTDKSAPKAPVNLKAFALQRRLVLGQLLEGLAGENVAARGRATEPVNGNPGAKIVEKTWQNTW